MDTLLALIGNNIEDVGGNNFEDVGGNFLNGVVINIRPKGNRIGLWIKTSNPEEVVTQVRNLVARLNFLLAARVRFRQLQKYPNERSSLCIRCFFLLPISHRLDQSWRC